MNIRDGQLINKTQTGREQFVEKRLGFETYTISIFKPREKKRSPFVGLSLLNATTFCATSSLGGHNFAPNALASFTMTSLGAHNFASNALAFFIIFLAPFNNYLTRIQFRPILAVSCLPDSVFALLSSNSICVFASRNFTR